MSGPPLCACPARPGHPTLPGVQGGHKGRKWGWPGRETSPARRHSTTEGPRSEDWRGDVCSVPKATGPGWGHPCTGTGQGRGNKASGLLSREGLKVWNPPTNLSKDKPWTAEGASECTIRPQEVDIGSAGWGGGGANLAVQPEEDEHDEEEAGPQLGQGHHGHSLGECDEGQARTCQDAAQSGRPGLCLALWRHCVCTRTCMYVCTGVYVCTCARMCVCACVHRVCVNVHECACAQMYMSACVCECVCTNVYVPVCTVCV